MVKLRLVGLAMGAALCMAAADSQGSMTNEEIAPGLYATLLHQGSPWSVWRIETKARTWCKVVAGADNMPPPAPVGFLSEFSGGTPRIEVSVRNGRPIDIALKGEHLHVTRREYRFTGERFWRSWGGGPKLETVLGRQVDVHIESWEYPAILAGRSNETGTIDFTELNEAIEAARDC